MHETKRKKFWRLIPLLAGVLIGVAGLGIWLYTGELNRQKEELVHFLEENPNSMAVVTYTFDKRGTPVEDGSVLFRNADTPFVMASTMKTIVLAAYADAVMQGVVAPQEKVAVKELEKYHLPFTDGNAHKSGLASLGLSVDENGFAVDQSATITLDDIARMMIDYSGNAETDYLIARLGSERIQSILTKANMEHHGPIKPILTTTLAMFNHENADNPTASQRSPEELMSLYLQDPSWREAQIAYIRSGEVRTSLEDQAVWMDKLFARGTAREYARLMAQIASGNFISPEVSRLMQQKLENVPTDWPLRLFFYHRLGAKEGVCPGVLTLASYMTPKSGPMAGKQRVVVLLINNLPSETWVKALQSQSHFFAQADIARGSSNFASSGSEK